MTGGAELPRLLSEALERLGVSVERVRIDDATSGGGLCNIKGRQVVFLERRNSSRDDVKVLTDALKQVADENTFLPPAVREWLDNQAS